MTCVRCNRRLLYSRGLCATCYSWAHRHGTLADYERKIRPRDETLREYDFLSGQGLTRKEIAEKLGIKDDSLYRTLYRAGRL